MKKKFLIIGLIFVSYGSVFGQKRNNTDVIAKEIVSYDCNQEDDAYSISVTSQYNVNTKETTYSIGVKPSKEQYLRFFDADEFLKLNPYISGSHIALLGYDYPFLTNHSKYPHAVDHHGGYINSEIFWAAAKQQPSQGEYNNIFSDKNQTSIGYPKNIYEAVDKYNEYLMKKSPKLIKIACIQEKEKSIEIKENYDESTANLLDEWFAQEVAKTNVSSSYNANLKTFRSNYITNIKKNKTSISPVITLKKASGICNNTLSIPLGFKDNDGYYHKYTLIKWSTGEKTNSIVVNQNKEYSVAVSSDLGNGYATINVSNNPSVTVSSGSVELITVENTLSISDYSKNISKITWSTKESTPTIVPKVEGQYYFNIETTCGNFKSNTVQVYSPKPKFPTGSTNYRKKEDITINSFNLKIYPNVVSDNLNIEIPAEYTLSSVKVYDLMNNIVGTASYSRSNSAESIDLSHLKSGNYIVEVEGSHGIERHRIVKE